MFERSKELKSAGREQREEMIRKRKRRAVVAEGKWLVGETIRVKSEVGGLGYCGKGDGHHGRREESGPQREQLCLGKSLQRVGGVQMEVESKCRDL